MGVIQEHPELRYIILLSLLRIQLTVFLQHSPSVYSQITATEIKNPPRKFEPPIVLYYGLRKKVLCYKSKGKHVGCLRCNGRSFT